MVVSLPSLFSPSCGKLNNEVVHGIREFIAEGDQFLTRLRDQELGYLGDADEEQGVMGAARDALYLELFDALGFDARELETLELIQESALMRVLAQLAPLIVAHSIRNIVFR